MLRRPNSAALRLESLEVREVPAVVLDGSFTGSTANNTFKAFADGGSVTIREIGGPNSFIAFNSAGVNGTPTTKPANNVDNITLSNNGSTLTLTDSDGIFIRLRQNGSIVNVGNTLDVPNVTGLTVDLQLGGDDAVTDNTRFASTINGGVGNDTLSAAGGEVNPLLLQFLLAPGGLNPAFLPLLGGAGGQKVLQGGDGTDTLTATGFATNFTLDGGTGDDRITGPIIGFFNSLRGGDGSDTVIGGLGLDVIDGGAGFDVLFGFGGGDFYLAFDGGPDFILNQKGDFAFADPFDFKNPV